MSVEQRPGSVTGLPDDTLGAIAVSLSVGAVRWTPDVAPAVIDRVSRDAVAYPEQFDRRPTPTAAGPARTSSPPSLGRTAARILVFVVLAVVVVGLVMVASTSNMRSASGTPMGGLAITLEPFAEGLDSPVFVTAAGDDSGRMFAVEQGGRIRVIDPDGAVEPEPFLDLSEAVVAGGEQGLLGLAFHPDFAVDGRFFVDYTRRSDGATVVSEFHVADDGTVDRDGERQLLVIEQPFSNHNGGMLAFDREGMLLIGTGDGGSGGDPLGNAQDPSSLLGKLLRIDVDRGDPYGIPTDNGFISDEAYRPEIHVVGLRNPWRYSVDGEDGDVIIGDVGQDRWEEIDLLPGGAGGVSLGWSEVEGPECFHEGCRPGDHVRPVLSYGHDEGCTVIGGYVYRGASQPALDGTYLFGDYCSGTIWAASAADLHAGTAQATQAGVMDGTLVSFGVDDADEIYVVDQAGRILHVVATEPS